MNNIGIYIHVPFCDSLCPYCGFYKLRGSKEKKKAYEEALLRELEKAAFAAEGRKADSLYIGGGTPSCLSAGSLAALIERARALFNCTQDIEITVECNPSSPLEELLSTLSESGVNRISLGLQSAAEKERKSLGRLSSAKRAAECIELIRENGITNISLDLMLGIPGQTTDSLCESLDFIRRAEVPHVSAYILQIEEGTYFYKHGERLGLPDDEQTAALYFEACEELEAAGLRQYEISNFALPGFESRHNLKYWKCGEYLGIGPSAHSFMNGKRFHYEPDLEAFIDGSGPSPDGSGGDFNERLLLALRLREGFREKLPKRVAERAREPLLSPYLILDGEGLRLTRKGFIVSNEIISRLID